MWVSRSVQASWRSAWNAARTAVGGASGVVMLPPRRPGRAARRSWRHGSPDGRWWPRMSRALARVLRAMRPYPDQDGRTAAHGRRTLPHRASAPPDLRHDTRVNYQKTSVFMQYAPII